MTNAFKDYDVLPGRGQGCYCHSGNRWLRDRVRQLFPQYDANKAGRRSIERQVVREVTSRGGRFFGVGDNKLYYEMPNSEAVDKVKMSFINLRKKRKSNKNGRQQPGEDVKEDEQPSLRADTGANRALDPTVLQAIMEEPDGSCMEEKMLEDPTIHSWNTPDQLQQPTGETGRKQDRAPSGDGAIAALMERLSGDRGEEMAQNLLSILDSVEATSSPATPNLDNTAKAIQHGTQVETSIRSLLKCKLVKRRRLDPSNRKAIRSRPSRATEADKSMMDSVMGALSLLSFKTETDMESLDIVKIRIGEDAAYVGSVMDGLPHGVGCKMYDNGKWLVGHWSQGKLHGSAAAIYENGDRCFGNFAKNRLHGKATFFSNDSKYLGHYIRNQRHGKGTFISFKSGTYNGDFILDRFEGPGTHIAINGKQTHGEFKNWICVEEDIGGFPAVKSNGNEENGTNQG